MAAFRLSVTALKPDSDTFILWLYSHSGCIAQASLNCFPDPFVSSQCFLNMRFLPVTNPARVPALYLPVNLTEPLSHQHSQKRACSVAKGGWDVGPVVKAILKLTWTPVWRYLAQCNFALILQLIYSIPYIYLHKGQIWFDLKQPVFTDSEVCFHRRTSDISQQEKHCPVLKLQMDEFHQVSRFWSLLARSPSFLTYKDFWKDQSHQ